MSAPKLSFSFAKKIEKKSLQPSAIRNDLPEAPKNIAEVIESIDENVIRTNEKEAAELVIPLVKVDRSLIFKKLTEKREQKEKEKQKNEVVEESSKNTEEESSGTSENQKEEEVEKTLTFDEQAALEVIRDSKRALEQQENTASVKSSLKIEVDKLVDSDATVVESSVDDYEKINIESFGAAMLRGMGWKKTGGVGTKRKVVEVVDPDKKGFSLSTNPMEKPVTQAPEEELELKPSAHVVVLSGRNKGVYGTVQTVDEDHILIRPARNSSNILREVEFNVRVVSKEEFKDSGRVINKEMYDEYKRKDLESKKRKVSSSSSSSCDENSEDDSKTRKEDNLRIKDEPYKSEKIKDEKVKTEIGRYKEDYVEMPKERTKKYDKIEVERPCSSLAIKMEDSLDKISVNKVTGDNIKRNVKMHDTDRDKKYSKCSHSERDKEYTKSSHKERDREYSKTTYSEREKEFSKSSYSDHSKVKGIYTSDKQERYDRDRKDGEFAKRRDDYSEIKSKRKHEEKQESGTKYSSRNGHSSSKDQKSKHTEKYKEMYTKEEKSKKSRLEDKPVVVPWVRENLRVRFINKNYKGGRYYKEKVVVLNVLTAENCECVTEEGKVLRDINPTWLETVIPKTYPWLVQVVQGKHKGLVGRILEQHKEQEKASVQVLDDETVILKLHYDDICEIVK
ncbi:uncharacterized protein LOC143040362 isoform X1 [Oratosquilla oratoria]|uniref:uncharacterized protein LOC143040362 isoform X1 n=1 Tax=Oratosquilla oratoria TaxID=337810 RepID=UPI003F75F602